MKKKKKLAGIAFALILSSSLLMTGITFASDVTSNNDDSRDLSGTYYNSLFGLEDASGEEAGNETETSTEEDPTTETETAETETSSEELTTEEETTPPPSTTQPQTTKPQPVETEPFVPVIVPEDPTEESPEETESGEEETDEEELDEDYDIYEDIGIVMNSKPERFGTLYWPLPSEYGMNSITSGYGYRTGTYSGMHAGLDIGAPEGTPIYACEDGIVLESYYSDSAGNFTIIQHEGGLYTEYMHQSVRYVKKGDAVKAGQMIGLVGSTGWSTGPHLHIGVVISDAGYSIYNRVDPTPYLTLLNKLDASVRIITQQELMIKYENGTKLTKTAESNPALVSSLDPILTKTKIKQVSYAGFSKQGYVRAETTDDTAAEVVALSLKEGYDRYEDTWIKYEGEDYDILVTLDASYNSAEKACPLAFRLDTVGYVINRPVFVKKTMKKRCYRAVKEQADNYFAVGLHVEVYKHGTEERIDLPDVYQALKDVDQAQSYRCLNDAYEAGSLFVKNKKTFNTNDNKNKKLNRVTTEGDVYSDYSADPLKELVSPGTANVYRKTEKLRTEGLDLVYGFHHDEFAGIDFYLPKYKITFNVEKGGKISKTSVSVLSGERLEESVKAKAKKNYKFAGWITEQDVMFADTLLKKGEVITMEQIKEIVVTDDLSFTATFEKVKPAEKKEETKEEVTTVKETATKETVKEIETTKSENATKETTQTSSKKPMK